MDRDRWQQMKAILDGALRLPEELRDPYLEEATRDESIRTEVRSLLASYASDPDFLESAVKNQALDVVALKEDSDLAGQSIGHYRLIREIGRGGMGTVLLAERADGQYKQFVAIKLVRESRRAEVILQRLRQERQILARLSHPNIARLLDGGATDDGLPYLVMEYVDGTSIHDYCTEQGLSTAKRLELFTTICDAVHYAHQNLVIHRDLKPSNILVTSNGRPKLLDFGIAKLLDEEEDAHLTRTGLQALTPAYASPEQVLGVMVSTASDTYSLGVILFELLTGHRPYTMYGKSPTEIEHLVCVVDPPKPSTIFTTGGKDDRLKIFDPPDKIDRLKRQLEGDLDTIVLKALRKDPTRRYASAADLAADIHRHLANEPVTARPDTVAYRVSRFVRRHQIGVFASALIALSLIAAVIGTSWQAKIAARERDRANDRFADVHALANTILTDLHGTIRDLPGTTHARQMLVAQATKYLDILANEAVNTDSLGDDLAVAYEQLGEIRGDPHFPNLGDISAAKLDYAASLAIRERIWHKDTTDVDATLALAKIVGRVAVVNSWAGDNELAIQQSKQALSLLDQLPDDDPLIRHTRMRITSELGWWYVWAGRMDDGLAELDRAERQAEELLTIGYRSLDFDIDRWRIIAYQSDGHQFNDDEELALAVLLNKGAPLAAATAAEHPNNPRGEGLLETNRSKTARMYEVMGRTKESLAAYDDLRESVELQVMQDTADARLRTKLAGVYHAMGELHLSLDKGSDALPRFEDALGIRLEMRRKDPTNAEIAYGVASTMRALCRYYVGADDLELALSHCEGAARVQDTAVMKDPHNLVGQGARKDLFLESARIRLQLAEKAPTQAEKVEHQNRALAWFDRSLSLVATLRSEGVKFDWVLDPSEIEEERRLAGEKGL